MTLSWSDRISFRRFLGYPESIPDSTTVWLFRERLAESGGDRLLWAELQRQLDMKGVVQEASFITAQNLLMVERVAGPGARVKESREQDARLAGSTGILPATIYPISRIPCLH